MTLLHSVWFVTWSALWLVRFVQQGTGESDFGLLCHYKRLSCTQSRYRGANDDRTDSLHDSNMKFLVALVALISVCNANVLWHEAPKTNVDLVTEAFWDYVAKATQMAEDSLKQVQSSELGQEVNTKLSQSADTVNQYVVALRNQAGPLSQDLLTQITQQADSLKTRLETELSSANVNLQPYAEQFVTELQTKMDELKRDVAPLAEAMDPDTLKTVLMQKSQELKTSLQAQMGPYADDLKQKMEQSIEEFQTSLMPLATSFEAQLNQKVQEVQQTLAPYGEELKAKLEANAQDVRAQISALWEAFTQKTAQ
ncbi:hypothetical protein WMY93_019325 [Mugilogobius chulae]|uniref:Apolipoprotein A-IV n=1 Tax=Mugilogobius chulae TaxID=88201 RepID=A0AAW0NPV6_9GOBI